MAFIGPVEKGRNFEPGWFLESARNYVPKTRQMTQDMATEYNGEKYVFMGTIYPANDATAEGIVYEDICVTYGDAPGSVIVEGRVYEDRLPVAVSADAKAALEKRGFKFIPAEPAVERPY